MAYSSLLLKITFCAALLVCIRALPAKDAKFLTQEDFSNGDLLLANETQESAQFDYSREEVLHDANPSNANRRRRWTGATIPYEISSLYTSQERSVVAGAIQEYARRSCVKFVQRRSERDYIHITPDDGQGDKVSPYCYSWVGKMGGKQFVKMYNECVRLSAMIHELGHVIGFEHEHNRADRDTYINVLWDNISRTYHYAYQKVSANEYDTLGLPYDYTSIMHYPDASFALPGKKAFTLRRSGDLSRENLRLSNHDIAKIKKYYNC